MRRERTRRRSASSAEASQLPSAETGKVRPVAKTTGVELLEGVVVGIEPQRATFAAYERFNIVMRGESIPDNLLFRLTYGDRRENGGWSWRELFPFRPLPLPAISLPENAAFWVELQIAERGENGAAILSRVQRVPLGQLFSSDRTGRLVSVLREVGLVIWGTETSALRVSQLAFIIELLAVSLCEKFAISAQSRFWKADGRIWTGAGLTTSKAPGMKVFRIEPFNADLWVDRYIAYWAYVEELCASKEIDRMRVACLVLILGAVYFGYQITPHAASPHRHLIDSRITPRDANLLVAEVMAALDIPARLIRVNTPGGTGWLVETIVDGHHLLLDVINGELIAASLEGLSEAKAAPGLLRFPRYNQVSPSPIQAVVSGAPWQTDAVEGPDGS